ncbi:MAG: IMP dehydrogenase [Candidatus Asgardarchaeia archaeon]
MGYFTKKIEEASYALTFNDLILLPGWIEVEPNEISIKTKITPNIPLNIPFVSAPMDTVTEDAMAIALAREGGVGFIHRNCTIEEQVEMAKKVKRAESLIIRDVITISPDRTVKDARKLMELHNIHGLPVVTGDNIIEGIVTWRDIRYAEDILYVKEVMTGKEDLITAREGISVEDAKKIMHEHRIEKLPIVDEGGKLIGLITIKDLELKGKYPNAARDEDGRLLCGAAVSPFDIERAKKLDKYVDIIVTDVAHFHNKNVFEAAKKMSKEISSDFIVGNIGTYEAALDCLTKIEGVGGLRVGIGSGSICKTAIVARAAAPTVYATASTADAIRELGADIPIIADGGIRNPGDAAIALALGASCVMMGNIFAGCKESPGRLIAIEGRYYKEYYGMGSYRARKKRYALDRYSRPSKEIEEGVEGWVPYRGLVSDVVKEFVAGLKAAMGYAGAKDIRELWKKAKLALVTPAGMQELNPHDLLMPRESNKFR